MLVTDACIMQPDPSRNQDLSSYTFYVELAVYIMPGQEHYFIQALKDLLTVLPILFQLKLELGGGGIHQWTITEAKKKFYLSM